MESVIREAFGIKLQVGDDDDVADLIARRLYEATDPVPWTDLPRRTQTRRRNRVKKRLHTRVVDRMTPECLADRDAYAEVAAWLDAVTHMAGV